MIKHLLFRFEAERAHHLTIRFLALVSQSPLLCRMLERKLRTSEDLRTEMFGLSFPHRVGIAPGFDKNALAIPALASLCGSVEVGTIVAKRQEGNPRPRVFRLPEEEAIINRFGFNSDGAEAVAPRIYRAREQMLRGEARRVPIIANIGMNKPSDPEHINIDDAVNNHLESLELVMDYVDGITLNCASPNTPGLRSLLEKGPLTALIGAMQKLLQEAGLFIPFFVKMSPDMSLKLIDEVLQICIDLGVSGVIGTNTTLSRFGIEKHPLAKETGGLSGKPLFPRALDVVTHIKKNFPTMPIIGSGGVCCPDDARRMRDAGADLLQVYTGLVYKGPGLIPELAKACA